MNGRFSCNLLTEKLVHHRDWITEGRPKKTINRIHLLHQKFSCKEILLHKHAFSWSHIISTHLTLDWKQINYLNHHGFLPDRAVDPDPDPHGSAFIFPLGSGSGSRRVNLSNKNWKNARKLLITATLLSVFKVNLHKLYCFLLLSNLLCFLQLFMNFFLQIWLS